MIGTKILWDLEVSEFKRWDCRDPFHPQILVHGIFRNLIWLQRDWNERKKLLEGCSGKCTMVPFEGFIASCQSFSFLILIVLFYLKFIFDIFIHMNRSSWRWEGPRIFYQFPSFLFPSVLLINYVHWERKNWNFLPKKQNTGEWKALKARTSTVIICTGNIKIGFFFFPTEKYRDG